MRGILRERIFRKHYEKLVLSRKNKSRKHSINTISSVTILTEASYHKEDDVKKAMHYFRRMGMICHLYIIKAKGEVIDISKDYNIINAENCQWFGVPNKETLIRWLSNKTDLLILSNYKSKLLMKYLCAASNSKLKTSVSYEGKTLDDSFIDFVVDVPQKEVLPLIDQCQLIYSNLTKIGIRPPVIG